MTTIPLSKVQKSMESKRKKFLKENSNDPKRIRFGNDPEVFDFVCRFYKHQYDGFHGNVPGLSEIDYEDDYNTFASKDAFDYRTTKEILEDDLDNDPDVETKYLLDLAKRLRRRYGGR